MTHFLVVVVLVLGMTDTVLALTDSHDGRLPERCLAVSHEACQVSLDVFSIPDAGDESADLDQLLRSPSCSPLSVLCAGRATPHLRALLPQLAARPLLRPPSLSA
ncbi:MAG: hypothetical protein WCK63_12425 [Betaproteobacteria bacterium]